MPGLTALFLKSLTCLAAASGGGNGAAPSGLPALQDPVTVIAIGMGGFVLVYLMFLRPRAKNARRRDPLATPPSVRQSLASERATERAMQSLVIELEKMSRQIGAQLDTKAAKLEVLIGQADERIAQLNRLGRRDENLGFANISAVRASELATRLTDGLIAGRIGAEASGLAALAKHREIYDLADNGQDVAAIAGKLHRPKGEVELILALRASGGAIG